MDSSNNKSTINSWKEFAKNIRLKRSDLLSNLPNYADSILVAGCQRSGTTAVANIITNTKGMINYLTDRDSELEAALILSGEEEGNLNGRYCFQTTFLNECVDEYLVHSGEYKLIWLIRNPHSVVYSMMFNWGNFAFNELFDSCGKLHLTKEESEKYKKYGRFGFSKLKKACYSYNIKSSQILILKDRLSANDFLVIDYDELVLNSANKLKKIYDFLQLEYSDRYSAKLMSRGLNKFKKFSEKDKINIDNICMETYLKVRSLAI